MPLHRAIPLIRAAVTAPMRRWLSEQDIDPNPLLRRSGLDWIPDNRPLLPIPVRGAISLLVEIARVSGPDAPLRIARDRGIFEIGPIGAIGLAGPTVREGLHAVSRNMPKHCTHEIFTVENREAGLRVGDGWAMTLADQEAQHLVQQYLAALVDGLCLAAGQRSQCLSQVRMTPHPEAGLAHLRPWLGDRLAAGERGPIVIEISDETADLAIAEGTEAVNVDLSDEQWGQLRTGGSLSEDVRLIVTTMLPYALPSIERIAGATGASQRTLRRRLKKEGTTLSDIVDRARAELALARLQNGTASSLGELAAELGYGHQSALTRAVRRWTGESPKHMALRSTKQI